MEYNDLKVVKPFFVMDVKDVFKYDEHTGMYTCIYSEGDEDTSYNAVYTISTDYAAKLLKDGFLSVIAHDACEKCDELTKCRDNMKLWMGKYNNLRDHIIELHDKYSHAIANPGNEKCPKCLQVEQETVLRNLLKLTENLIDYGFDDSSKQSC